MLIEDADRRAAIQNAARRPAQGRNAGFADTFSAAMDNAFSVTNSNVEDAYRGEFLADFRKKFFDESGQSLPPMPSGAGPSERSILPTPADFIGSMLNERATTNAKAQFDAWKANNPNSSLEFPSEQALRDYAVQKAQRVKSKNDAILNRSSGVSGGAGALLGGMTGAVADPSVLPTLLFGAGAASGILRTALIEGGIGAASEAAVQAQTFDFRQAVEPDRTIGDAASEVALAGAGGAVFGGGLKALAKAWSSVRGNKGYSRETHDAGNAVLREAAVPASRFEPSVTGQQAHRQALNKAVDDLLNDRPVELPPEAFVQQNARPGRVYDVDGKSHAVRYEVVEANDLVTSNRDDMTVNPDFPEELQPRDRTRAISRDQIQNIASRLQPERLGPSVQADGGAPIVGPDGVVESGNARTLAIRRAYQMDDVQAQNYRNYLSSQGFDTDGIAQPVLVARRVSDLDGDGRRAFVASANRSTALRMGAAEQAKADARLIESTMLDAIDADDIGAAGNRNFVRGFMQRLPRSEQGDLVDARGQLSASGIRRVNAAMMARAYEDTALLTRSLEDAESNIRSIAGALQDAAPTWARLRDDVTNGVIPNGMDITDDLLSALRTVIRARDEGMKPAAAFRQSEMFDGPSEIAKVIGRALFGEGMNRAVSRKAVAKLLTEYADEARKNLAGPRLLDDPLEASDIMRTSLKRTGRLDLADALERDLDDAAIDSIASSPDVEDAVVLEAQRLRAEPGGDQIMVDVPEIGPDGEEVMVSRSLDDVMEEADAEIAEAERVEACASGVPEQPALV